MFADECVTPRRCRELATFIQNLANPIFWQAEVRFEQAFTPDLLRHMYEGGCRQLMFGNESVSQRVLDLMNKGTSAELNREIIRNTSRAGIAVHLYNILGFPGETKSEAEETVEFLISGTRWITSCGFGEFILAEFSPVHRDPKRFGVIPMRIRSANDLLPKYVFRCISGASRAEIGRICKSATVRVSRAYPCQLHFLDSVCGAHMLLYIERFGVTKIEALFHRPEHSAGMFSLRPHMCEGVRIDRLRSGRTLLYCTQTAERITLSRGASNWLEFADGQHSLEEIVALQMKKRKKRAHPNAAQDWARLLLTARDLAVGGFLSLE